MTISQGIINSEKKKKVQTLKTMKDAAVYDTATYVYTQQTPVVILCY
jgi:hypothetical protein